MASVYIDSQFVLNWCLQCKPRCTDGCCHILQPLSQSWQRLRLLWCFITRVSSSDELSGWELAHWPGPCVAVSGPLGPTTWPQSRPSGLQCGWWAALAISARFPDGVDYLTRLLSHTQFCPLGTLSWPMVVCCSYLKTQCQIEFLEFDQVHPPVRNSGREHLEGLWVDDADLAVFLSAHWTLLSRS